MKAIIAPVLAFAGAIGASAACGSADMAVSVFQDSGAPDGSVEASSVGSFANGDSSTGVNLLGDGGDSGIGVLQGPATSVHFQPASATIVVDGITPQTAQLTLIAVDAQGDMAAVAPESLAFDRPDLATPSGAMPIVMTAPSTASPYAGVGTLHAIFQGLEATATLTVQVHLTAYGSGLTASSPAVVAFVGGQSAIPDGGALEDGGADASAPVAGQLAADPAPGIRPLLYPYDGTVWPLGLTSPLVMWSAPQTGDVYWLHYAEKNYSFDGYYALSSLPAQLRLDQTVWDRLTASNDAANGPDPLTFVVSRWDQPTGVAYTTATETWTVAPESLRGAIYYWTASEPNAQAARVGHISRFQPGTGATPQQLNNGVCMGCHAVNAQGTILVADIDDNLEGNRPVGGGVPSVAPYGNWSGTRPWASFDVTQQSSPLVYQSNEFGADVALTPDGRYLVFGGPTSVPGSKFLSLGDPLTGNVIATSQLDQVVLDANETNLEMPAFSPDGTMMAVVESANAADPDNVLPGQPETVSVLAFDETAAGGPVFDPTLHPVVSSTSPAFASTGGGLGYPSFTPDSKAVAFHAGTWSTGCATGCLDQDVDNGDLFIATIDGGAPIRLAAANDPPDPNDRFASVEPTFNPIVRGGYSWVVFTSMRNWGNSPWPDDGAIPPDAGPDMHVNAKRRLWVAAVDTSIGTVDPSHPAIYLEGQDDTPNMRGFWTLASCIPTPGAISAATSALDAGAAGDADATAQAGLTGDAGQAALTGDAGQAGLTGDAGQAGLTGDAGQAALTGDAGQAGLTGDAGQAGLTGDAGQAAESCTNGFECCSGFCEQGVCADVSTITCVGLGHSCTTAADCCNAGVVVCANGTCAVPAAR
jgi:hypothetical protein